MKEGYKKTELGWMPNEWKLDNVNKITYLNPESLGNSTDDSLIINYIDIESVKAGKVLGYKEFEFSEAPSRARRVVKKNDVIVSTVRPNLKSIAKINFDKENLICSTGFAVLRKKESIDSEYLFQFAMSDIFTKQLVDKTVGSNYPAVNSTDIKETLIFIPPLKEQKKIAEILSTVDSQIDDSDKLIEKTKELKKGLMQRLLTKGIGHTKFKKTEVGEIPVEWEVKQIIDISDTMSGGTPNRSKKYYYEFGNICWVKTGELSNKYIYDTEEKITDIAIKESSAKLVPINSVIVAMYGATIGKISINKREVTTNQACCSIICKQDIVDYEFLYYILLFNKEKLIELGAGGAQPNISQQIIKSFKVIVPNLNEQKNIANILSSIDKQIEECQNKKIKLEELKKGLMQQLLTGKIRVI